ncbi:hypothetical protein AJ87_04035 [Rhizobium yanglingense]|nr:hypothetical protein AJ87_04035 [Rhizobium yanglingense]
MNIDTDWAFAYAPNAVDPTLLDRSAGTFDERLTAFVIDNQLEAKFETGDIDHTLLAGLDLTGFVGVRSTAAASRRRLIPTIRTQALQSRTSTSRPAPFRTSGRPAPTCRTRCAMTPGC